MKKDRPRCPPRNGRGHWAGRQSSAWIGASATTSTRHGSPGCESCFTGKRKPGDLDPLARAALEGDGPGIAVERQLMAENRLLRGRLQFSRFRFCWRGPGGIWRRLARRGRRCLEGSRKQELGARRRPDQKRREKQRSKEHVFNANLAPVKDRLRIPLPAAFGQVDAIGQPNQGKLTGSELENRQMAVARGLHGFANLRPIGRDPFQLRLARFDPSSYIRRILRSRAAIPI